MKLKTDTERAEEWFVEQSRKNRSDVNALADLCSAPWKKDAVISVYVAGLLAGCRLERRKQCQSKK